MDQKDETDMTAGMTVADLTDKTAAKQGKIILKVLHSTPVMWPLDLMVQTARVNRSLMKKSNLLTSENY